MRFARIWIMWDGIVRVIEGLWVCIYSLFGMCNTFNQFPVSRRENKMIRQTKYFMRLAVINIRIVFNWICARIFSNRPAVFLNKQNEKQLHMCGFFAQHFLIENTYMLLVCFAFKRVTLHCKQLHCSCGCYFIYEYMTGASARIFNAINANVTSGNRQRGCTKVFYALVAALLGDGVKSWMCDFWLCLCSLYTANPGWLAWNRWFASEWHKCRLCRAFYSVHVCIFVCAVYSSVCFIGLAWLYYIPWDMQ